MKNRCGNYVQAVDNGETGNVDFRANSLPFYASNDEPRSALTPEFCDFRNSHIMCANPRNSSLFGLFHCAHLILLVSYLRKHTQARNTVSKIPEYPFFIITFASYSLFLHFTFLFSFHYCFTFPLSLLLELYLRIYIFMYITLFQSQTYRQIQSPFVLHLAHNP